MHGVAGRGRGAEWGFPMRDGDGQMKPVELREVWKRFMLPEQMAGRLKDALPFWFGRRPSREFWALKGVSFDVAPGEALGIIGPNGAGKSTILKLITGITRATRGTVATRGRVAALIEVGAGFHPDLTGRENVYLNGAFMGLRRREITERFDRIVEFAGLEGFLDVPVKRYSSGMYMRLGFAVAAHIDPEILLVDEVLAVGDISFQMKCLDKIKELRERDRTIIFVSHHMKAVAGLCDRVLLLANGEVVDAGDPASVIARYRSLVADDTVQKGTTFLGEQDRWGSGGVEITGVELLDRDGRPVDVVATGDPLTVRIGYMVHKPVRHPVFEVEIHRTDRTYCCGTSTRVDGIDLGTVSGTGTVELHYRELSLLPDGYYLSVGVFDDSGLVPYDFLRGVRAFTVQSDLLDRGLVYLPHRWTVAGVPAAAQPSCVAEP